MNRLRLSKLLQEIADGELDDHIRALARACFKRRGVLQGKDLLMDLKALYPGMKPLTKEASQGDWSIIDQVPEPVFTGRVSPQKELATDSIIYRGAAYDPHDIIGKVYYNETYSAFIKIVGLGKARAKVRFLTMPRGRAAATAYENQNPIFVNMSNIEGLLEIPSPRVNTEPQSF